MGRAERFGQAVTKQESEAAQSSSSAPLSSAFDAGLTTPRRGAHGCSETQGRCFRDAIREEEEDGTEETMDVGAIPITQAEAEGSTDQNTAGGDIRGGEKRKSECGEEPPSTRVRLQALVDALHSVSEFDEGVSTTSSVPQV